ncbi:hypothetical protein RRG08_002668 [Elysia crispata]|uniref:Uncharacterized protein n=1 Tax=Elysia crispata TaxID=231223 RepID=A0AAE0XTP9_9GAST|nr:hypothetical protein RRG08_002668 [Elysia crispata]
MSICKPLSFYDYMMPSCQSLSFYDYMMSSCKSLSFYDYMMSICQPLSFYNYMIYGRAVEIGQSTAPLCGQWSVLNRMKLEVSSMDPERDGCLIERGQSAIARSKYLQSAGLVERKITTCAWLRSVWPQVGGGEKKYRGAGRKSRRRTGPAHVGLLDLVYDPASHLYGCSGDTDSRHRSVSSFGLWNINKTRGLHHTPGFTRGLRQS